MKVFKNIIYFSGVVILLFSCNYKTESQSNTSISHPVDSSLLRILERKKLIAVTSYSPINYFIYRGETMGYEYEMLQRFANTLGVDLEIKLENDVDSAIKHINQNKYDIIALGLTVTNERKKKISFTTPILQTRQILVQRKHRYNDKDTKLIRNPLDLDSVEIHITGNKMYRRHLRHLEEDLGIHVKIIEHPGFTLEELIDSVATGKFDYAVCDEHIAKAYQKFVKNIDIKTPLSLYQNIAWGLAKDADSLKKTVNNWLSGFLNTKIYKYIYNKYFVFPLQIFAHESYHSYKGGKISEYDPVFREAARMIGWDWRLLAALAYQESKFNPDVKAWTGAFGIMQLMPETAAELGIDTVASVKDQILAGAKLLKQLDDQWKPIVPDSAERINFVLASYNVGTGHVLDARRLAAKYGKDTNVWENNVDYFLLNKSKPEFYNDSLVKYGRCRGSEPYRFVKEIKNRYWEYRKLIPE